MNTIVSQEMLQTVFDEVTRDSTEKVAGIHLSRGEGHPPGEDVCTVYAAFERGFHSSLTLCADTSVFTRLTQNIMQETDVTPKDVEDFTKEFFNILCGSVASKLFQTVKVPSRFEIPHFCRGRYEPENLQAQFVIQYYSERQESVQLIHHVPIGIIEGRRNLMKKRIMVVDDSRMILMQLQKLLADTAYEVIGYCQDGESALEHYEELHPDLVTMDIIMPGIDGLETARTIMQAHPDAKIVMVSSLVYDDTIEEAMSIGAKDFIYKPFEKEQVLEILDKIFAEDHE